MTFFFAAIKLIEKASTKLELFQNTKALIFLSS